MNKAELIDALAQHYDGSRAEATKALNAVVQTITRNTAAGEKVAITGFGVFERVERPARTVRNPRTGERQQAEATAVPRFRPGTELKAYVAGLRPLPEPDGAGSAPAARRSPRRSAHRGAADDGRSLSDSVAPDPEPAAAPAVAARSAQEDAKDPKVAKAKDRGAKGAKADGGKAKAGGKDKKDKKDKKGKPGKGKKG